MHILITPTHTHTRTHTSSLRDLHCSVYLVLGLTTTYDHEVLDLSIKLHFSSTNACITYLKNFSAAPERLGQSLWVGLLWFSHQTVSGAVFSIYNTTETNTHIYIICIQLLPVYATLWH